MGAPAHRQRRVAGNPERSPTLTTENRMDRFTSAKKFNTNPPPRMAPNTPVDALVVFDGWQGGIAGSVWFKALQELKKGEVYSVRAINESAGQFSVVLNETNGNWPISLFSAYNF